MKASKLRFLLAEKPILKVAGAHNALGAKLIERHGFDAVWSSGFEIATANGVPDANILTMTENLEAAININTGTNLPVICDCDTGYGNAINAMHMIKKYEAANMAAVVIEDKRFPKVNSFIPGRQELASIEEFVGKIEAMRAARVHQDGILIIARLEALISGWGVEEAYRRAMAYYEAGADGLVIHSKSKNPDEIFEFARIWNKNFSGKCPLVAIPTTYPQVTTQELTATGFKIVIYANQGMRASVRAMNEVFAQIQCEGTTQNIEKRIAAMDELFALQGMPAYQEQEKLYSGDGEPIEAVIPAAADHKFQPELSSLLEDQPLCMVKIAGKSLLEHQVDALRTAGVRNFNMVVGYQKEKIAAKGIKIFENPFFQTKSSAYSVFCGLSQMTGRTLVAYCDILFDSQIPEALTKSPYAITLVIDQAFRTLPRRDKSLDLVLIEDQENSESRKLQLERFKKITRVGKKIENEKANYEFIGMMLFSKQGLEEIKKAWADAQKNFADKPFYEAPNAAQASMTDLFQYMIDRGNEIRGLVIEHGWSELYSLEDYERLEHYFSQKSDDLIPAP